MPPGRQVVGCYKPVYPPFSPTTYYSPGSPIGDPIPPLTKPDSSSGTEEVRVPMVGLFGVFVWFEYGQWLDNGNGFWFWHREGVLCNAFFVPNSSSTCFAPGTHVLTPEGSMPIEELRVGDYILSTNRDKPKSMPTPTRIKQVVIGQRQRLVEIIVNGKTIHATPQHPVYLKGKGWVPCSALKPDDQLRTDTDRWARVESVTAGAESTVYSLWVDGKSSYFVGHKDWGFAVEVSDTCKSFEPRSQILANLSHDSRVSFRIDWLPKD